MLRIDTGMHTAMVNRVGVDAACRLAAVWSGPNGIELNVWKPT